MSARIPASIRNNNPGAIFPGKVATKFGSTSFEFLNTADGQFKIARFTDPVQGGAAMFYLLHTNYTGLSMKKAITKWCGDLHADTYLKVLKQECGAEPDDILTKEKLADPKLAIALAKAMALQEAGRAFPMTPEQWRTAHASALNPVAPAWSPDNDVPTPKEGVRTEAKVKTVGTGVGAVVTGGTVAASVDPSVYTSIIGAWKGLGSTVIEAATWVTTLGKFGTAAIVAAATFFGIKKLLAKMEA